jgi:hypothetical protein
MKTIENRLDTIINLLHKVVELLDKPKQSVQLLTETKDELYSVNAVSKEEVPFPTPWNSPSVPSCKSDILYKEPTNPNWYNINQ